MENKKNRLENKNKLKSGKSIKIINHNFKRKYQYYYRIK